MGSEIYFIASFRRFFSMFQHLIFVVLVLFSIPSLGAERPQLPPPGLDVKLFEGKSVEAFFAARAKWTGPQMRTIFA